jgi:proliferating cell nuclear antigen
MFEAVLGEVSLFRDSMGAISDIIDEAEMQIKAGGLKLVAADRAVVVVIDFFMSKDAFRQYDYTEDAKVGLNLTNLMHILKRARPEETMHMKLEGNKFHIIFRGSSTRSFVLPLIDVSREEIPPIDKLVFPASIKINSDLLNSGVEDAELIGDSIILTARKDSFVMRSESDTSLAQMDMTSGTSGLKIIEIGEPVRSRFSTDYLKKIMKARKLTENVSLSMSTDYPLKVDFDVPGKMQMSFILAPRVEE